MTTVKFAWALSKEDGLPRHVIGLPKGLACNCRCPNARCSSDMEAINSQGDATQMRQRPHFRHAHLPTDSIDCVTATDLVVAKQALLDLDRPVKVPPRKIVQEALDARGKKQRVVLELPSENLTLVHQGFLQDDAIAKFSTSDGRTLFVVLSARAELKGVEFSNAAVIAIDIHGRKLSLDDLVQAGTKIHWLLQSAKWLCHWKDDEGNAAAATLLRDKVNYANALVARRERLEAKRTYSRSRESVYWYGCANCRIRFPGLDVPVTYCRGCRLPARKLVELGDRNNLEAATEPWSPSPAP